MRVEEAVQHMTKAYLHRIIDSFTRDFQKGDEDKSREIILRNAEELTDPKRVATVLQLDGLYSHQVLLASILETLVNCPGTAAAEQDVVEAVTANELEVIERASDPDALRYEDAKAVEIFRAVLEVALEDERLTEEELGLLRRLREKLGLSERAKQTILAQLGHFPRAGNRLHTPSEFKEALLDLQRRGVVFYCNKLDGGRFVVPEEIVPAIRDALGIELSEAAWTQLVAQMTKDQMATILEAAGVPKSGSKDELKERILSTGLRPSRALDSLSNSELYDLCDALPGAKVSGTKGERVQRLIDYFANLVVREVPEEASPGERYYQFFKELARRDRETLLANKVVKKDIEMERGFEEATRYLFRQKLGLDLVDLPGSEHPDGCVQFKRSGDLLFWDNKSKETVYSFPESHLKQFKRYIRDSATRVSCFLVIVPEIGEGAAAIAARLKVESGHRHGRGADYG